MIRNINLIIFLICLQSVQLYSNESITDSLLLIAENTKGIEKARLYNEVSNYLFSTDPERSIEYSRKALEISKTLGDAEEEYRSMVNIGIAYSYIGKNSEALDYHLRALESFEKELDDEDLAIIHNELGIDYTYTYNYEMAIQHFLKSLHFRERLFDDDSVQSQALISVAYNNMGLLYQKIKNFEKAVEYYNKALSILLSIGDSLTIAKCYNNIGIAHDQQGNYGEALQSYLKALAILEPRGPGNSLARTYGNLGIVYQLMGEPKKSLEYSYKAIDIFKETGDQLNLAITYNKVGQMLILNGRSNEALPYLQQGLEIAIRIKSPGILKDSYQYLVDYYSINGDYKQAFELRGEIIDINDSIYSSDMLSKVSEMQTKYETEKKEKEIAILTKDNKIQRLEIKRQQILFWGIAIGLTIVLLILMLVFIVYRLRQRNIHTQIEKKSLETEQRMLRSQMNPHFIFNSMSSVQAYITRNDNYTAMIYLSNFAELMRNILENSRQAMVSLSEEINTIKLYIELERLRFNNKFDFTIDVDKELNEEDIFIPPMLIQPFVENAIKHGLREKKEKGMLIITFKKNDQTIICSVIDNGIGRDKASKNKAEGHISLGMQVTKERLEALKNEKKVNSYFNIYDLSDEKGTASGTHVDIKLPFEEE